MQIGGSSAQPREKSPAVKMSAAGRDSKKTKATKPKPKKPNAVPRSYNRYNIFFILERELLIRGKGGTTTRDWGNKADKADLTNSEPAVPSKHGYENLNLPPLPPRFASLTMPEDWFVPGREKKRRHRKSHGVASFRELARTIADSWKTVDKETLAWCMAVEKELKERSMELRRTLHGEGGDAQSNSPGTANYNVTEVTQPKKKGRPSKAGAKVSAKRKAPTSNNSPGASKLQKKGKDSNDVPSESTDTAKDEPKVTPTKNEGPSLLSKSGTKVSAKHRVPATISVPTTLEARLAVGRNITRGGTASAMHGVSPSPNACPSGANVVLPSKLKVPARNGVPAAVGTSIEGRGTGGAAAAKRNASRDLEIAASILLPPGWKSAIDRNTGKIYYYRRLPDRPPPKKRALCPGRPDAVLAPDLVTSYHALSQSYHA